MGHGSAHQKPPLPKINSTSVKKGQRSTSRAAEAALCAQILPLIAEIERKIVERDRLAARTRLLESLCQSLQLALECVKAFKLDQGRDSLNGRALLELEKRIQSLDSGMSGVPLEAQQLRGSAIGELFQFISSSIKQNDDLTGVAHTTVLDGGLLSLYNCGLIAFLYDPEFRRGLLRNMSSGPKVNDEIIRKGCENLLRLSMAVVQVRVAIEQAKVDRDNSARKADLGW
jgi:hypothetical protein